MKKKLKKKRMKMKKLLLKHKNDYKTQPIRVLIEIIEDALKYEEALAKTRQKHYKPEKSKVNNAKRAIKKMWPKRADIVTRARIKKHIITLREYA